MSWFREEVRCDNCWGSGCIYDYYDCEEGTNQPKQKVCPKCNGRGCVEVQNTNDD